MELKMLFGIDPGPCEQLHACVELVRSKSREIFGVLGLFRARGEGEEEKETGQAIELVKYHKNYN